MYRSDKANMVLPARKSVSKMKQADFNEPMKVLAKQSQESGHWH
ncbi:hypothetical protein [Ligilactobacillus sp. WC1T17]